jgi:predicted amidohydrolase
MFRAAAVQLNSSDDKQANLARAGRLVQEAAAEQARLVVLPEKFNVLGGPEHLRTGAETLDGPTIEWAQGLARDLSLWLVAGSITERVDDDDKLRNTSVVIDPDGRTTAVYRKLHMFDVEVGGRAYRESDLEAPGDEIVVADIGETRVGISICYDLRFPELFRIQALNGAEILALPSAFTVPTGEAHWEVLVRARAIENQAFLVAAGQVGQHPGGHRSYGHSMIVDPWGQILAEAPNGEGFVVADLDFDHLARVRLELPSLANRRPQSYVWPTLTASGAA